MASPSRDDAEILLVTYVLQIRSGTSRKTNPVLDEMGIIPAPLNKKVTRGLIFRNRDVTNIILVMTPEY